jgi:DNA-binding NarL/FixJ family response regulator
MSQLERIPEMSQSLPETRRERVAREMARTVKVYRQMATNPALRREPQLLARLDEVTAQAERRLARFLAWSEVGQTPPETLAPSLPAPVAEPTEARILVAAPVVDKGPLTRRHQEVVQLVARGLTNAEIARELVVEPGTVANHVAAILNRLGFRSRAQIAVWAVEHGYSSGEA